MNHRPTFEDPKTEVLFEDIQAAGKLATDLKLYSVACVLYALSGAMLEGGKGITEIASAVGDHYLNSRKDI